MTDNLWETIHAQKEWGRWPAEELVRFVGGIPKKLRTQMRVAELGCGIGANLRMLAEMGFPCIGIDISQTAATRSRTVTNASVLVADVGEWLATTATTSYRYNLLVDVCCLQHQKTFADIHHLIDLVYDVLDSDGMFFCMCVSTGSDLHCMNGIPVLALDKTMIPLLFSRFKRISVEQSWRTYGNGKYTLGHNIIVASK